MCLGEKHSCFYVRRPEKFLYLIYDSVVDGAVGSKCVFFTKQSSHAHLQDT